MSKEAEEYYQDVKKNYEGNGVSFKKYEDVFSFAESYHQHRLEKDMPSDKEIAKRFPAIRQDATNGNPVKNFFAEASYNGAKWLKSQLLKNTK